MSRQLSQGNIRFNSGMYNQHSLYPTQLPPMRPPPIHITRDLYEINGQIVSLKKGNHMTNLNLLTQKWDSALTIHDTPNNHVGQSNLYQNSDKIQNTIPDDTHLPPQYNFSEALDKNRLLHNNAIFHAPKSFEYTNIEQNYPVISSSNLLPQSKKSLAAHKNIIQKKNSSSATKSISNFTYTKREDIHREISNHNNTLKSEDIRSIENRYATAVKTKLKLETNEFKVSNEDFPELPKTKNYQNTRSLIKDLSKMSLTNKTNEPHTNSKNNEIPSFNDNIQMNNTKPKMQIHPNGQITNIPGSMVHDQYGIIGTLSCIKTKEEIPFLTMLCFGEDLTQLGMPLNSSEDIYPNFEGPYQFGQLGPNRNDMHVPPEYRIQEKIKNRLPQIKLSNYCDLTLFYLFYTYHNDRIQLVVADELFKRGWRYHTELFVWMTNVEDMPPLNTFEGYEEGTYYIFDIEKWRQVPRGLKIDCSKLENRSNKYTL